MNTTDRPRMDNAPNVDKNAEKEKPSPAAEEIIKPAPGGAMEAELAAADTRTDNDDTHAAR